ncbi:aldehyde dehydrogenase [Staphylococcus haemolyticus]|uniref:aldehyde dehydrogenase n=1 Tax=Staphylococcus haemolyticus TaxID=1283 RepID=UPI00143F7876|nr:aldehyde dehydrogenase [Staphylococcus haemolyticus]MCH4458081.1 aldehyde dehydrogenase [Staphylococcus haemolyticus]MCH4490744.1 aldehyde dehydrogenase [Staphylococcus haemolyticus]MDU0435327.1 aldehyde dehydrogenase [Staphylococcus haemolyticus]NKN66927.1 aldehyde dehydrogenase [Staphylococcus haemolyticus]
MKYVSDYVCGEFINYDENQYNDVINPSTEEVIAKVPKGNLETLEQAINAADEVQSDWEELPPIERGVYLKKIANEIRNRASEIIDTIVEEGGKIHDLAKTEVYFTADYLDYMAEWARRYEGEIINSDRPNEHILLYKKALGVTTGILPWNFPFFLIARKAAPALITGNTIVIKPSVETPINAQIFAEIVDEVKLPKGVLNIVNGSGSKLGSVMANHEKVSLVSLTGSETAGQKVMLEASKTLTNINLELGGKAPAIVMKDANINEAVKNVIDSRIINTGQVCNCVERVYVDKAIKEDFIKVLVSEMKNIHYSNPCDNKESMMGPLINKKSQRVVHEKVERAISKGATLLCGGEMPKEKGYFYPPTVLDNCHNEMEIVQEETFGPVLPIISFNNFEEAIHLANDSKYGLTSSIYTNDLNIALKAINKLKFGETYVNRENFEAMQGFHAGVKHSGIGGADGKHGLEEYLRTHVAYIQIKN